MWLISTKDQRLVNFVYEKRPEYAILSHRWDDEHPEVSFQDMFEHGRASLMPNFDKILKACNEALSDGLEYIWIDTCCINKESSAELSEAINSMYGWYKAAKVCYALLVDVEGDADTKGILNQISNSEWFTRGWTLQELIAPNVVVFFNHSWQRLGTKLSLRETLTARTGISTAVLTGWEPPSSRSIAEGFSWASQRKTTRVEDEAYCLLGIFGVNMPMLYGEGARAFTRLQEEIMKVSDDQSIFAWPLPKGRRKRLDSKSNSLTDSIEGSSNRVRQLFGLLADSPAAFKKCGTVGRKASRKGTPPYTMTNRGLSISLWAGVIEADTYLVQLNCDDSSMVADQVDGKNCHLGIFLTCLEGDGQFARVAGNDGRSIQRLLSKLYEDFTTLHFYIPQYREYDAVEITSFDVLRPRINGIRLKTPASFDFYKRVASYDWDTKTHLLTQTLRPGFNRYHFADTGITLDLRKDLSTGIRKITFGVDRACNPVCFVATEKGLKHDLELEPTSSIVTKNRGLMALERSKTQSHPFLTRRPFDELEWSSQLRGKERYDSDEDRDDYEDLFFGSKDVYAMELKLYSGLWAIKGDRIEGMCAYILPAASTLPLGHVRMKRSVVEWGPSRGHLVWDVWFSHPPFVKSLSIDSEPGYDEILPS